MHGFSCIAKPQTESIRESVNLFVDSQTWMETYTRSVVVVGEVNYVDILEIQIDKIDSLKADFYHAWSP